MASCVVTTFFTTSGGCCDERGAGEGGTEWLPDAAAAAVDSSRMTCVCDTDCGRLSEFTEPVRFSAVEELRRWAPRFGPALG